MRYEVIVIGVSAGGLAALKTILPALPKTFPAPVVVVQHRTNRADEFLTDYLNQLCQLSVREVEDKEPIRAGHIYLAPAGYHVLVEPDKSFSLSTDMRVNYSCPSVDVLFESAADAYKNAVIGVVLTGANADGAQGLRAIRQRGGVVIVQDPESAEAGAMPRAALAATPVDHIVPLERMTALFIELTQTQQRGSHGTGH